ncbi:hypothetical protein NUSPORA_02898 [Nucleospora cyclopteri]
MEKDNAELLLKLKNNLKRTTEIESELYETENTMLSNMKKLKKINLTSYMEHDTNNLFTLFIENLICVLKLSNNENNFVFSAKLLTILIEDIEWYFEVVLTDEFIIENKQLSELKQDKEQIKEILELIKIKHKNIIEKINMSKESKQYHMEKINQIVKKLNMQENLKQEKPPLLKILQLTIDKKLIEKSIDQFPKKSKQKKNITKYIICICISLMVIFFIIGIVIILKKSSRKQTLSASRLFA